MNKTLVGLVAVAAAAVVTGAIMLASDEADGAVVNKTVSVIGSTARVSRVCFDRNAAGTVIEATAFATALIADGGVGERGTTDWQLNPAARTTANAFMDGPAVVQWRTDHGLEQ